ncbi:MAG: acyl carrier protein [Clostridia bacterium]|nr:acyl carrier protein [Bacillota bacterium]MBP3720764.1 acyl carrier protein [Clostridia bacterium]
MSILEQIKKILDDRGLLDDIELTPETNLVESGLDSLDLADLAMDCEETFDIEIDLDAAPTTVGDLINIIKAQTGIEDDE